MNTIKCQLHGACFDTITGDIEDCPSRFSVPVFDVSIRGSNIYVKGSVDDAKKSRRDVKVPCLDKSKNSTTYLLIGGGIAAATCAEKLRETGFTGRIVVVCREPHYTYDRTKVSKALNVNSRDILVYQPAYWEELGVDWRLNIQAVELDAQKQFVKLSSGEEVAYDKALIATGGDPISVIDENFMSSKNVYIIRTIDSSNKLSKVISGKNGIIIGSSFIGMEIASCLVNSAKSVTVIGRTAMPYQDVLGYDLGKLIQSIHIEKGVCFEMETEVVSYVKEGDEVAQVSLKNGKEFHVDFVIVGVGVKPATSFVRDSNLMKNGYLVVDETMRVQGAKNLYAAGDAVIYPLKILGDELYRVGHWSTAMRQGMIAGYNMNGIVKHYDSIPYFWSLAYGKTIRYSGHGQGYDSMFIDRKSNTNAEKLEFAAYYSKNDRVIAVATLFRDPIASVCAQLIKFNKMPKLSQIKDFVDKNNSTADSFLISCLHFEQF